MTSMDSYKAYLMTVQISESFLLAYARFESGDDTAPFSRDRGIDELRKLATHLGFQLAPADADETSEAA